MKYLLLPGTCLIALFISVSVSAQTPVPVNEQDQKKPKLFTELITTVLQTLINTETGKAVSFRFGANASKSFTGQVVSKTEDQSIRSVVIRSGNYNGATLTLSSSTQPNGTVKFTGRIISFQHGDLYELQNQNDQYILVKKNFYDLINE